MREILFRGKTDKGEWVHGNFIRGCVEDFAYIVEFGNKEICRNYVGVIPETIGQYTGLRDCKRTKEYPEGQMIFEGDIVKVFLKDGVEIGYIRYRNAGSRFQFIDEYSIGYNIDNTTDFEVIGNVHDNPQLLKGGADNG